MRYIVVQDCWRWVRVDDKGKVVEFSEHSYPNPEFTVEDLEQSEDRQQHKDAEVEIRHNPKAGW